ncbi:hypothetical protein FHG87_014754 [Trinorchestia longiramus]|nr:hypothetical protein FHG87_014754 [Trinorchestia longiramus]
MSSLSSSGGDSDGWISIDSSMECIPPTPSQPLSPCQVMISDGLFSQIGGTGELLDDQQLLLSPLPAIEINPDKNLNPEVQSFEGFSPEQGDVITPVQHNKIGAWKVKCHLPANQITSVGTIGPFGKDTSSEELTEALIDAGFGGVKVEQIYKVVHTTAGNVASQAHSCCNCSGNHTANYGDCRKIRQAREVEKIRQIQKLSYRDAARQVLHAGGTSLVQPHSDQTLNISMVTQSGGKDQYSSKAQPTKLVSVGTQTGDELISPTSPNVTVTQLVELLARTLTAVTRQDEDLNLKDLIIEIAKDTFKSQVLNTSANNERLLTTQPQYNDCSDPSNLMTTLDMPTTQVTPSPILGRQNPRKRCKTNAQTSSTATKNKSLHTSEKHFCTKNRLEQRKHCKQGKINLPSDLGLHGLVFEAPNKQEKKRRRREEPVTFQIREYVLKIEDEMTSVEIETFLKKVKNGKASGPNDIPNEFYKHSDESIIEMLRCLFDEIWRSERVPDEWNKCNVVLLHKGGHKNMKELKTIDLLLWLTQ